MNSRSTKNPLADKPSRRFCLCYLNSGVDYYIAGRYAVFAKLMPTSQGICSTTPSRCFSRALSARRARVLNELERLKHKLPKIWNEFKTNFPEHSLDAFDPLISELNKFE